MSYRKRKRENRHQTPPPAPDLDLLIQAHEADVICGPQAERAAAYLEVERRDENTSLIRWAASGSQAARPTDSALRIHDEDSMPAPESGEEDVWVDRYASLAMGLPCIPCSLLRDPNPALGSTKISDAA